MSEEYRIAVSCHPSQGGSGVVATELAMALADRGHEVHMVNTRRPFRLPVDSPVRFHEVSVFDYPLFAHPPVDLCLINKLAEVVNDHEIDLIHAHYAVPHAIAAMLAAQMASRPVKVLTTVHGTDITLVGSHRDFYSLVRHAMCQGDALTAVSHWLADETRRSFDLEQSPLVIENFVDCRRFSTDQRVGYPADGKFTLMHASNFRPVKRVCDIIQAFALIRGEISAELLMLGDGPERGLAEELAAELGVSDDVRFTGSTLNVTEAYRQSHLFLLLSTYESFGLSALEAMACGTPVIASRAGGLLEVIEDGRSGRLCPVGKPEQVAAAALELLGGQEIWSLASAAARERAHHRFCRDLIVPHYEQLYRRVIHGRAGLDGASLEPVQ